MQVAGRVFWGDRMLVAGEARCQYGAVLQARSVHWTKRKSPGIYSCMHGWEWRVGGERNVTLACCPALAGTHPVVGSSVVGTQHLLAALMALQRSSKLEGGTGVLGQAIAAAGAKADAIEAMVGRG